jgi:hypothetical protein
MPIKVWAMQPHSLLAILEKKKTDSRDLMIMQNPPPLKFKFWLENNS